MARTSKTELTWQAYRNGKGGRWCKIIDGKRHYFGTATKKADTHAYRKALAAYRIEQDVRDRRNLTADLRDQAVRSMTAADSLGWAINDPDEFAAIMGLPSKYSVEEHEQRRLDQITLRYSPARI